MEEELKREKTDERKNKNHGFARNGNKHRTGNSGLDMSPFCGYRKGMLRK
jgi:hypothetical protein